MNTLFSWFNSKIADAYGLKPASMQMASEVSVAPANSTKVPMEMLRQLGAPEPLLSLFAPLIDCEISFKQSTDGPVPDLEQREKKRKRSTGQFYTPESLAARLVKMAKPEASGDILDPACGDGSFLLAMAGLLRSNSRILLSSPIKLPVIPAQAGIHNSQITHELNGIGIKVFENERITDSVFKNGSKTVINDDLRDGLNKGQADFGCGFLSQLHGYDIDLQALFVCLTRLLCAFPGCGWPVLEQRDFLLEPPSQKFALIIGNPPYRVNLDSGFKERLAEIYKTGEGEKDLYTFFLEGSLRALKPGGQLIMLTSHTYLVNHQCEKIRNFIFARYSVEALLMLPGRFFATAPGVLPVVIVADCTPPEVSHQLRVATDYTESGGWQREYQADSAIFLGCCGLRQAIVPDPLRQFFAAMDNCRQTLGQSCRVGVGIQESLKRDGPVSRHVSKEPLTPRHRPVLRGRELSPFKITWEENYIDYGPHLAYSGCEKTFAGPKILYQNIRNEKLKVRLVAAFDEGKFFPKNSLSYVVSDLPEYSPMFMLGLLNSLLVNAWFSGRFHSFHVTVTQVRQIPLPPVNSELFLRVADLAAELTRAIAGSSTQIAAFSQLNEAVCECYLGTGDYGGLIAQCDNFLEQAASL